MKRTRQTADIAMRSGTVVPVLCVTYHILNRRVLNLEKEGCGEE